MNRFKKLLLIFVAAIAACFMSLSFVACGDQGKPSQPPEPDDGDKDDGSQSIAVAQKTVKAVTNLYTVNGLGGAVKVDFVSDLRTGGKAIDNAYSIVKRGDRVEVKGAKNDGTPFVSVVDLKTGYMYTPKDGGYAFEQIMPAYSLDYALYMTELETSAAVDKLESKLAYDADTKTVTYDTDAAKEVNAYLEPLYADGNTRLEQVADDYVAMLTAKAAAADTTGKTEEFDTFDEWFDDIVQDLRLFQDQKLGDLFDMLKSGKKVDIYAELGKFGISFTADQKTAIAARTVTQATVAVSAFVNDAITEFVSGMTSGQADGGNVVQASSSSVGELIAMLKGFKTKGKEIARQIIQAAFFAPVAPDATFDGAVKDLKDNIDIVLALNKQQVITMLGAKSPALAQILSNKVKFETLEFGFSLTFDADYNASRLAFDCKIKHGFNGAVGVGVLADNNYALGAEINVSEYSSDGSQKFETALAHELAAQDTDAIVYGKLVSDAEVYIESSAPMTVVDISAALGYEAGEADKEIALAAGDIAYDGDTKTLTVKAAFLAAQFAEAKAGAEIKIKLFTDSERFVTVKLMRLTDDKSDMFVVIENLLAKMINE